MENVKEYWLTPPDVMTGLDYIHRFDFDPCPYPRPEGYNSLIIPWGRSNYVNPPFNKKDAPFGGPSAFARKAIAERNTYSKKSVFVLPLPHSIGLLMAAGARCEYGGVIQWLDGKTKALCPRKAHQAVLILE